MSKTEQRERQTFTDDFKRQMVLLYKNGKKRSELIADYDLTSSALNRWIKELTTTGSFKAKDNRSREENELLALRKENKQLLMENDILKQAALIMGSSVGRYKNAELVMAAISKIPMNLSQIELFHSDRGKEFDNQLINECLAVFNITRSLSDKGCPYDNAVAEATFKTIKTEFVKGEYFNSLDELRWRFGAYVHWYNYGRLHSTLGYLSPATYAALSVLN